MFQIYLKNLFLENPLIRYHSCLIYRIKDLLNFQKFIHTLPHLICMSPYRRICVLLLHSLCHHIIATRHITDISVFVIQWSSWYTSVDVSEEEFTTFMTVSLNKDINTVCNLQENRSPNFRATNFLVGSIFKNIEVFRIVENNFYV